MFMKFFKACNKFVSTLQEKKKICSAFKNRGFGITLAQIALYLKMTRIFKFECQALKSVSECLSQMIGTRCYIMDLRLTAATWQKIQIQA